MGLKMQSLLQVVAADMVHAYAWDLHDENIKLTLSSS